MEHIGVGVIEIEHVAWDAWHLETNANAQKENAEEDGKLSDLW